MRPWANRAAKATWRLLAKQWQIWVLALIPVLITYAIIDHSPAYVACIKENPAHTANDAEKKDAPTFVVVIRNYVWLRIGCSGDFVEKYHDAIIALFTVLLAVVTSTLWLATERLVKGAEDTARRQLRAYIHAAPEKDAVFHMAVGFNPFIKLQIINTGQTPAVKIRMGISLQLYAEPANETWFTPPDTGAFGHIVIHPGKAVSVAVDRKMKLAADEVMRFDDQKARFYVFGRITYEDTFGIERHTNFRFVSRGIGDGLSTDAEGRRAAIACEQGNYIS